jgi:hypothetical protein
LVSPQYQAYFADTGATVGAIGPAVDPSGGDVADVAAGSRQQSRRPSLIGALASAPRASGAPTSKAAAAWYRVQNSRYQLHGRSRLGIKNRQRASLLSFLAANDQLKVSQIGLWIDSEGPQEQSQNVISGVARPNEQATDAKLLLQLGIGLGFVYLSFLVAWFWTTRDRPHGVARVVRF